MICERPTGRLFTCTDRVHGETLECWPWATCLSTTAVITFFFFLSMCLLYLRFLPVKETSVLLFIDIITSFTPTRCQCRSSSVLLVPTLCSTALLYQAGVSFLTSAPGLYLFIYLVEIWGTGSRSGTSTVLVEKEVSVLRGDLWCSQNFVYVFLFYSH